MREMRPAPIMLILFRPCYTAEKHALYGRALASKFADFAGEIATLAIGNGRRQPIVRH